MAQVEVKINSVNFICDWNYNITTNNEQCCVCHKNSYEEHQSKSKRNCALKVYGLVAGKCGHVAHLSCYKSKLRIHNKYGNNFYCGICENGDLFEFDKNLEEPHTQKLYKI
jgi:hypothetical protein